jgi:hypothetical protein
MPASWTACTQDLYGRAGLRAVMGLQSHLKPGNNSWSSDKHGNWSLLSDSEGRDLITLEADKS